MLNRTTTASSFSLTLVATLALGACASHGDGARVAAPAHSGAPSTSASKQLTFESLYGPKGRVNFSGSRSPSVQWLDARRCIVSTADEDGKNPTRVVLDTATGTTSPIEKDERLATVIATIPGIDEKAAKTIASSSSADWDKQREAQIVERKKDLWIARLGSDEALQLTNTPEAAEEEAGWSPDGSRVAFVVANDLYVADSRSGETKRLTVDGSTNVLNGKLDWLYLQIIHIIFLLQVL